MMLSSRYIRCLSAIPASVLAQSSLLKLQGQQEISVSKAARLYSNGAGLPCHCCEKSLISFSNKKVYSQAYFTNVRSMSTRKRGNKNSSQLDTDVVDPDLEEDFIEDHVPAGDRLVSRVKVKFNWKNSLVTADAVNLLETLYRSHPQLVEFKEKELLDYFQTMSIYSIDVEKAAKIVIMNPRLIRSADSTIPACINALRSIGLGESQRGHVIYSVPDIFSFPPTKIVDQFSFLKTWLSKNESVDVVCKSADVLLQSEATLKSKLEYLIKGMSHETKNIVTSKTLSYSLRHIKTRHEFLIRCGLFKPIPYRKLIKVLERDYKDRNKPRNKYFRPLEIVCYKDEDFLKACTNNLLTLNEYAAFEELYRAELEMMQEIDEEDEEEFGGAYEDSDDESDPQDAVSLVKAPNSAGFLNDVEGKSCYF